MNRAVLIPLLLLLCPVWAVLGQQSGISIQGGEAGQAPKKGEQGAQPLTNDSIVKLAKAKLGEDTIISIVNTQPGKYSLGADDIIALKTAGVPEKVITAMLNQSASAPTPASLAPAGAELNRETETTNRGQPFGAVSGTGKIKGTLTFYFNANYGNKPDVGAHIMLVSGRVETPDNATVYLFADSFLNMLSVDDKKYDAVKSTIADGSGNFELADIPSGEYTLVMQSNHVKGKYTYETVDSKKPNKKPKIKERLNQRDSLGCINSVIVTVETGKTTDESFDFGISVL